MVNRFSASPIIATAERLFQRTTDFIRGNPLVSTAALGIGTTGIVAGISTIKKRRKTAKRRTTKRTKKRKTTKSKRKTCKPCKRRKKSNGKRIRRTKNGQPYIILSSGKARFISRKSASLRRKRKGGYR